MARATLKGASEDARNLRLMVWAGVGTFLLDQASKWLVVHRLDLKTRQVIEVWPPFVSLRMAWNEGVNFGLLSGLDMRWVLVAVALVISTLVVVWVRRDRAPRLPHLAAGLLVGGALGNVVDRALYGAVADFLNVSCCGIDNPYAFNVADIAVFVGAAGLVLVSGGTGRRPGPGSRSGGAGGGAGPRGPRARPARPG